MWTIKELKTRGMAAFQMNYWPCVLVGLILSLVGGATSGIGSIIGQLPRLIEWRISAGESLSQEDMFGADTAMTAVALDPEMTAIIAVVIGVMLLALGVALLLGIFLLNPLYVGCSRFMKDNVIAPQKQFGALKVGFSRYWHTVGTMLLTAVFVFLWSLLLLVPGIIKGYSYRMVPFLVADHPELSATEVITLSRRMMDGHKWNTFVLDLSFLGWILLTVLTCGILGIFWTTPYIANTNAALYHKLKELGAGA